VFLTGRDVVQGFIFSKETVEFISAGMCQAVDFALAVASALFDKTVEFLDCYRPLLKVPVNNNN